METEEDMELARKSIENDQYANDIYEEFKKVFKIKGDVIDNIYLEYPECLNCGHKYTKLYFIDEILKCPVCGFNLAVYAYKMYLKNICEKEGE